MCGLGSLRRSPKSGRPETIRKITFCDCLPVVGVLLSDNLKAKNFKSIKTLLPTGRLIVGRDAPAQANSQRNHYFPGGQNLNGRI